MISKMIPKKLLSTAIDDLNDLKAINISTLDVRKFTPLIDYMVIATGNSSRHVKSICENLVQKMKARGLCPTGIESDEDDEWILVDLGDIVVHIMQAKTRDFYNLEKLWSTETVKPHPAFATG